MRRLSAVVLVVAACTTPHPPAPAPVRPTAPVSAPAVPAADAVEVEVPEVDVPAPPRHGGPIVVIAPDLESLLPGAGSTLSTDAAEQRKLAALVADRIAKRDARRAENARLFAARKSLRAALEAAKSMPGDPHHPSHIVAVEAAQAKLDAVDKPARAANARAEKLLDAAGDTLVTALAAQRHLAPDGLVLRAGLTTLRVREKHDDAIELLLEKQQVDNLPEVDYAAVTPLVTGPEIAALDAPHAAVIAVLRALIEIETTTIADSVKIARARELVALARAQPNVRGAAARLAAPRLVDDHADLPLALDAWQDIADTSPDANARAMALYELGWLARRDTTGRGVDALCTIVTLAPPPAETTVVADAVEALPETIAASMSMAPVVRACAASHVCPCDATTLRLAGELLIDRDRPDDARTLLGLAFGEFPHAPTAAAAACGLVGIARDAEALDPAAPRVAAQLEAHHERAFGNAWACPVSKLAMTPPSTRAARARAQIPTGALEQCIIDFPIGRPGDVRARVLVGAHGGVKGRPAPLESTLSDPLTACVLDVLGRHQWLGLDGTALTLSLNVDF